MDNMQRRTWGLGAILHGTPDHRQNDMETNAVDTIANVLHALQDDTAAVRVLSSAERHYRAERGGSE
jgi:hypothetical protein